VPEEPDVLVVLPTLGKRNERLRSALASIDEQRKDLSVAVALVVPTDAAEARSIGAEHGAIIVDDPGRGMSAAMNAGRTVASTEKATIWLGDDDAYEPGGLVTLFRLLMDNPSAVVAYGGCRYVDDAAQQLWVSQAGRLASALIGVGPNLIPHPAAMIRLDALDAVGGYDESLRLVMDLDVFVKLKKIGRFVSTKKPVATFGWHDDSLTVAGRVASEKEARTVKRRHLPGPLRPVSGLWEWPVAWASRIAAHTLNRRVNGTLSR
jgi:GT2 family glycosyltransferase